MWYNCLICILVLTSSNDCPIIKLPSFKCIYSHLSFPLFIKQGLLTVYSLHRYMFDSMGKTEVVEYSSGFQRPCANLRRLTALTIPTSQWFLTIKCYSSHSRKACMGEGGKIEEELYYTVGQEHTFSPSRALPSSRSWLHSAGQWEKEGESPLRYF